MVSMLASSAEDRGFKPKTMKLVFVASPLGIRIMCLIGATCLSTNCCFSELAQEKFQLSVLV
jgi:hypothetical protein